MKLISVDNHYAIQVTEEIKQICKPLFDYTPITFFNYVKIYNNGSRLSVASNPYWLKHYFDNQLQECTVFTNDKVALRYKFISHLMYPTNKVILDAKEFNICHGFSITNVLDDGCEYFHFATTNDHEQILNFYINNFDLLERFILYFKEKSKYLLNKLKPYQPLNPMSMDIKEKEIELINENNKNKFIRETALDQLITEINGKEISLSIREAQCLFFLTQGKSAKEIGRELALSNRTIENYLHKIKSKFNCYTRYDLLQLLEKHHLTHLLKHIHK